ncbi:hypothetical protein Tco_0891527 [Tanacetum coccineum]|uniref:Gag-Pol polyprotein n=1 Tax=Tanacetum coccineum TaxID=301880 RepID=A0ABQ5C3H5_9ASTR
MWGCGIFEGDRFGGMWGVNELVEIVLFIVDSGCSKHMTGNLKLLTNFVEKFSGMNGQDLEMITCTNLGYEIWLQETLPSTVYMLYRDLKKYLLTVKFFTSLAHIATSSEMVKNLDKINEKGDAMYFCLGIPTQSKPYRVFNRDKNDSLETIFMLTLRMKSQMASDHVSSDPEQRETSSRHVDSSNMHTFYQHHPSAQRWTKDHPLEQVIGNPSQSVRTRCQLETDWRECECFALTVSQTKPKNIKEAMADSAWIESMQEELH